MRQNKKYKLSKQKFDKIRHNKLLETKVNDSFIENIVQEIDGKFKGFSILIDDFKGAFIGKHFVQQYYPDKKIHISVDAHEQIPYQMHLVYSDAECIMRFVDVFPIRKSKEFYSSTFFETVTKAYNYFITQGNDL